MNNIDLLKQMLELPIEEAIELLKETRNKEDIKHKYKAEPLEYYGMYDGGDEWK